LKEGSRRKIQKVVCLSRVDKADKDESSYHFLVEESRNDREEKSESPGKGGLNEGGRAGFLSNGRNK